jgi:hypothetical protein
LQKDDVRSKGDMATVNDVLCKVRFRSIRWLIQETYELGVEPKFCAGKKDVEEVRRRMVAGHTTSNR